MEKSEMIHTMNVHELCAVNGGSMIPPSVFKIIGDMVDYIIDSLHPSIL